MNLIRKIKYFKIRNFICSKFGHKWYYLFTLSDGLNSQQKIRTCKRCSETQILKQFTEDFLGNRIYEDWSIMIGCTDYGAKKKFKPEHLKN